MRTPDERPSGYTVSRVLNDEPHVSDEVRRRVLEAAQQLSYRLRHQTPTADLTHMRTALQRRKALLAHTIYECGSCGERFVGVRRCESCNLFCRAVGVGERLAVGHLVGRLAEHLEGERAGGDGGAQHVPVHPHHLRPGLVSREAQRGTWLRRTSVKM